MNKLKQNLQLRTQKIYNLQQLYSVTTSSRNTVTRLTHVLFLINLHPQFGQPLTVRHIVIHCQLLEFALHSLAIGRLFRYRLINSLSKRLENISKLARDQHERQV